MPEPIKGFELALNIREKMLRMRAWGVWDTEFGKKYDLALRDKIMELSAQAHWQIWYVLVDFTGFSTPVAEVQRMTEHLLTTANPLGLKKIAYIRNSPGPPLPCKRARDGPLQAFFESKDEAIQWLMAG